VEDLFEQRCHFLGARRLVRCRLQDEVQRQE
jgi:hypothetical protein